MGGFPGAGDLGPALEGEGLPAKRMRVTYPGGREKLKGENSGEGVEGALWELEKRLGQTMGTLSADPGLRLTATGRHQYRHGMEPPGTSRGNMGGSSGPVQGRNQKGRCVPEQGLGGTRCEDHLGKLSSVSAWLECNVQLSV